MIVKRIEAVKVEQAEFNELLRLHALASQKQQELLTMPSRGERIRKQIYVWQKVAQGLRDALTHLEPIEQSEPGINEAGKNEDEELAF
ncbi:hypothetical protein [Ruegeria arenilitoris]|uniref:hypothetical protein n=1 Tax=Ruegeria arenilitoris TaxID=1173585 RepID=UPI00147FF4C2|nr:hypothetical protein [Ruegeria arenilitoris]